MTRTHLVLDGDVTEETFRAELNERDPEAGVWCSRQTVRVPLRYLSLHAFKAAEQDGAYVVDEMPDDLQSRLLDDIEPDRGNER